MRQLDGCNSCRRTSHQYSAIRGHHLHQQYTYTSLDLSSLELRHNWVCANRTSTRCRRSSKEATPSPSISYAHSRPVGARGICTPSRRQHSLRCICCPGARRSALRELRTQPCVRPSLSCRTAWRILSPWPIWQPKSTLASTTSCASFGTPPVKLRIGTSPSSVYRWHNDFFHRPILPSRTSLNDAASVKLDPCRRHSCGTSVFVPPSIGRIAHSASAGTGYHQVSHSPRRTDPGKRRRGGCDSTGLFDGVWHGVDGPDIRSAGEASRVSVGTGQGAFPVPSARSRATLSMFLSTCCW